MVGEREMEETDTQQLVKSQLNYVAMLQNIQPSRCVLIQCTDGDNKPDDGETSADDFNRKWQEWMKIRKHVKAQILTCSVLANELAFDPDVKDWNCLLYTSPSPRDRTRSRMPSSA